MTKYKIKFEVGYVDVEFNGDYDYSYPNIIEDIITLPKGALNPSKFESIYYDYLIPEIKEILENNIEVDYNDYVEVRVNDVEFDIIEFKEYKEGVW